MKKSGYSLFLLPLFMLIIGVFAHSCRDKYEDCTDEDYLNCQSVKPTQEGVEVYVTINEENPAVIVKMYRGDFENGNLVWEKLYHNRDETEHIDTETYYSFTVTYQRGNETITAVDGGEVKIISYRMCEQRCYETRPFTIDLRID
ncbi:MAG: hypothetical protein ACOCXS_01945 [Bacteroidota bacterium]